MEGKEWPEGDRQDREAKMEEKRTGRERGTYVGICVLYEQAQGR